MIVESTKFELMKAPVKNNPKTVTLISMLTLIMFQATAQAQELVSEASKKDAQDIFIGYYIIGGIISFGMIAYVIFNLVEKNQKDDEKPQATKHFMHRHHHRIVKKTA